MVATGVDGEQSSKQVRVCFVTKLQPPFKAPVKPIAVPSNLTRMGLSEIVNLLLKSDNSEFQPVPFDFLIEGELLRIPLEDFLLARNISAEKVLEIEYMKAVVPQRQQDPCLHDDWVSAVDGSRSSFVLTGCYDGCARIWKEGISCSHILEGHNGAITSVNIINHRGAEGGSTFHVASGSKDRTIRLWKFNVVTQSDKPSRIQAYKILNGHTSSVQSISSAPFGNMVCSGSWDGSINLWNLGPDAAHDSTSIKKRKVKTDTTTGLESQLEVDASLSLIGHTQCVSSIAWREPETIFSSSWDHSIRSWDVETSKEHWNLVSGKALNCLDLGGEGFALVAAGGSDPVLRIWDPRKPGTLAPVFEFSSHSSWITSCKWHANSPFHLLSSSYDGKVMIWDLRTAWPLLVINSHKDKVMCADWWKDDGVVSGGADSMLYVSSGINIIQT